MTTRGFLLGKFMPPHAGHITLARAAAAMVDELTILVCSLPGDAMPGEQREQWMRELFPECRVVGFCKDVPQYPSENSDFWPIWRDIVKRAHPETIDLLFAGEEYGRELAAYVGGTFVPLGGRVLGSDQNGPGGVSGTRVRDDLSGNWRWLPVNVRRDLVKTVVLHGVESTGKSTLAAALADRLGTTWVPEYGRAHCDVHGTDLDSNGLQTIATAHQAMIEAAKEWSGPVLLSDTDWLMTRSWHEMMLGEAMGGPVFPLADLYIHLPPDLPWVDDGTRIYSGDDERARFDAICRRELDEAGANVAVLDCALPDRVDAALALIAAL